MRRTKKLLVLVGVLSVFLLVSTTALAAPACPPNNALRSFSLNGCATATNCNTACTNAASCNTTGCANNASCNTTGCANNASCNTTSCNAVAGCTNTANRNASSLNALKQAGASSNLSALLQSKACAANGINSSAGNYAQFASLLSSLCKIK